MQPIPNLDSSNVFLSPFDGEAPNSNLVYNDDTGAYFFITPVNTGSNGSNDVTGDFYKDSITYLKRKFDIIIDTSGGHVGGAILKEAVLPMSDLALVVSTNPRKNIDILEAFVGEILDIINGGQENITTVKVGVVFNKLRKEDFTWVEGFVAIGGIENNEGFSYGKFGEESFGDDYLVLAEKVTGILI